MPTPDSEVSELLRRCIAGDQDAEDQFVKRFERLVAHAVRGVLGKGHSEQEDAQQLAWMRIFPALEKLDECDSLTTFLYVIAGRATIDFLRGRDSEGASSLDFDPEQNTPLPLEVVVSMEETKQMRRAIEMLPVDSQRHVELWMDGMSNKKIAAELRLPIRTVQWRFKHVILAQLQKNMLIVAEQSGNSHQKDLRHLELSPSDREDSCSD